MEPREKIFSLMSILFKYSKDLPPMKWQSIPQCWEDEGRILIQPCYNSFWVLGFGQASLKGLLWSCWWSLGGSTARFFRTRIRSFSLLLQISIKPQQLPLNTLMVEPVLIRSFRRQMLFQMAQEGARLARRGPQLIESRCLRRSSSLRKARMAAVGVVPPKMMWGSSTISATGVVQRKISKAEAS